MSEELKVYEEKMEKSIDALLNEYASIRAGRANPHVLDKIKVDYYGTPTPINQVGSISVPEPRTLLINPWDKSAMKDIEKAMKKSDDYKQSTDDEIATAAKRVLEKLRQVNSEYLSWFEIVLAMVFAIVGYNLPVWLLFFQKKMRKMEMENEVMQFQTIILMLMRIERVNVEMILEWLERYSNIFREPIAKCVNNYESGPWEALEEMKDDVNYKEFIRLIESMQAAVEKIPIAEAFDELDSERDYYQERRKESNARLIQKKGMIGKVIGFAPMVGLFVGYLIVPLVFIGLMSMMSSMNDMSSMAA